MFKYHYDNTDASELGEFSLNISKLEKFKSNLSFLKKTLANFKYPSEMFDEHLKLGDKRAAIVLQTYNRLIIAAYTDELDCIALLEFPVNLIQENNLEVGDRLLTVNTYSEGKTIASDLENGPESHKRYNNFHPLIADFLSDDDQAINEKKSHISEDEWKRALEMGHSKLMIKGVIPRNGSPYQSNIISKY